MYTKTKETTTTNRKTKTHNNPCPHNPRNPQKKSKDHHQSYRITHNAQRKSSTPQLNIYKKNPPPTNSSCSLSPITTPKMFSRSRSVNRIGQSPSPTQRRTHSATNEVRKPLIEITLCSEPDPSKITDHQLKTILKPLFSFKSINEKSISNPYLFRDAAKVTTFVRAAGTRTRELWRFIQKASCADLRLAELEHSSLKKMLPFCSGRVPILVHPSFCRSLKLRYPMDVGGITRDDRVGTELGTGSCVRPLASSPRRISGP